MIMKNFLLLLISFVTFNVMADYGIQGRSNTKKYDGTVLADSREKQFINVINQEGNALSAGMVAVWDVSNDDGGSVVISATRTSNPACVVTETCAVGALCKNCQTYGYYSSALFDSTAGAVSASGKVYLSGENQGYVSARAPLSSEQIGSISPIGFFYDTPSASAAVEIFINLR